MISFAGFFLKQSTMAFVEDVGHFNAFASLIVFRLTDPGAAKAQEQRLVPDCEMPR